MRIEVTGATSMTIKEKIEQIGDSLTSSERKVASSLLADYPFAGLDTIQTLAERTQVSAPSITRFVTKLGCNGYLEFQRRLIGELKESQRSPLQLRQKDETLAEGFLREYADRASDIARKAAEGVSQSQFDRVCKLLAEPARAIYTIGGRFSDPLAVTLSRHLKQIRPKVIHMSSDPEQWPDAILQMRSKDVLVMIDVRRYQPGLQFLARQATSKSGVSIVLITDKWVSPISQHSSEVLAAPIESGTAWDSYIGVLMLLEAMIARVAESGWDATEKRIAAWDDLRMGSDQEEKT